MVNWIMFRLCTMCLINVPQMIWLPHLLAFVEWNWCATISFIETFYRSNENEEKIIWKYERNEEKINE